MGVVGAVTARAMTELKGTQCKGIGQRGSRPEDVGVVWEAMALPGIYEVGKHGAGEL